jgi:hypothetical protein
METSFQHQNFPLEAISLIKPYIIAAPQFISITIPFLTNIIERFPDAKCYFPNIYEKLLLPWLNSQSICQETVYI